MIRVEVEQSSIRAGDMVRGRALWNSEGGKTPRKIVVELRWTLAGKGAKYEHVIETTEKADVSSTGQTVVPFQWVVPDLGPPSYQGKLFNITWEVIARADLAFAIDPKESVSVTVGPRIWTREQFTEFEAMDEDEEWDEDEEEEEKEEP